MADMGRPTDYTPLYCVQVIELGRAGKSHAQIAAALDVARQTLHNWCDVRPEFLDAMKRARDLSQAWWEQSAQDGLATPGYNAALWAKSMPARFPDDYSERSKVELTGKGGGPIETRRIQDMTDDELAAIAAGGSRVTHEA